MARPPKSTTRAPRPKETSKLASAPTPDNAKRPGPAAPAGAAPLGADDATVLRPAIRQATPPLPAAETRRHTLSSAMTHAVAEPPTPVVTIEKPSQPPLIESAMTAPYLPRVAAVPVENEVGDEVSDEVDEWSAADQPTIYLPPRAFLRQRPEMRRVEESIRLPALPDPPPISRSVAARDVPGRAAPPLRPAFALGEERLAAPDGRIAPTTPPPGVPRAALANPRMERFQELRVRRMSMDPEQREAEGGRPVAESVRQWWGDLLPGVERALRHQHEARQSGVHPLSPHDEAPATKLGDAFGRLSTSARQITQRTQAAVTPALRRLHDQAEQHAQALVERLEGSPARQQAPLLGPGRIAVFFQAGVSVRLAQAVLEQHQARPIRLIPRKQGFLAVVRPGFEAETAERLRYNQEVRDVAYLEFDEFGHPIEPR